LLNGGLFTRDFLIEGIKDAIAWKRLNDAIAGGVRDRLNALLASFGKLKNPTEAETENQLPRFVGAAAGLGVRAHPRTRAENAGRSRGRGG
jgi:hypothetical protein